MRPILFAACLAALPAHADPAADFKRLAQALPQLDPGQSALDYQATALELVAGMSGRWLLTTDPLLAEEPDGFPSPERLQSHCERIGMEAAADGPLGFTLSTPTAGQPFTLRMTWAGGNTFLATMDFAGAMERFFPGMKIEDTPGGAILNMAQNGQGPVTLLPAGEDLVLLVPTSQPVQLLIRCPG